MASTPPIQQPATLLTCLPTLYTLKSLPLYVLSFLFAMLLSLATAHTTARILTRNRIPVHRALAPNVAMLSIAGHVFYLALLSIANSRAASEVFPRGRLLSVAEQLIVCCVGHAAWVGMYLALAWAMARMYLRCYEGRRDGMLQRCFGWERGEIERDWEKFLGRREEKEGA